MRVVWQILAVAAISAVGGQSVIAVRDDPWLTLALGMSATVLAVLVYRWVVGRAPSAGRPRSWTRPVPRRRSAGGR